MVKILVLVPAAGAARRMRGADKLLEHVDGIEVLRKVAEAGAEAGQVLVTLQPEATARRTALRTTNAQTLTVESWAEGMAASLRTGAKAAIDQGATGLLVLLPDMPEIEAKDVSRFLQAHTQNPDAVFRGATAHGKLGHPVLIPACLFSEMLYLSGDQGAREIFQEMPTKVQSIILDGNRAILDLDTPEAWATWRKQR